MYQQKKKKHKKHRGKSKQLNAPQLPTNSSDEIEVFATSPRSTQNSDVHASRPCEVISSNDPDKLPSASEPEELSEDEERE